MSKWWKWFLPGYIWLAPFSLVYVVLCFVAYGARSWGMRSGVIVCIASKPMIGHPGAQTIGAVQCYADSLQINRTDLHVHENCHVVQAFAAALIGQVVVPLAFVGLGWNALLGCALGGFLGAAGYSLTYGLFFLALWTARGFGPWHDAYERNPYEVQAYRRQATWVHGMNAEQRSRVWS